jgi:hypothetical protein
MKTSLDLPDALLSELMLLTKTKTKRSAIITAITEYNQRRRMQALSKHLNSLDNLVTPGELQKMRQK